MKLSLRSVWQRHSIAHRILIGMILCLLLVLVLIWALNNFVLSSYCQYRKEQTLIRLFDEVNAGLQTGEELDTRLEQLYSNDNISVLLWQDDTVLYDGRPWEFHLRHGDENQRDTADLANGTYRISARKLPHLNAVHLTLFGKTDDGVSVRMSVSMESIQNGVDEANTFLLLSGAVALMVSVTIAVYLSRHISRPIEELNGVAEKMAKLDFSSRYVGSHGDEIDRLGNSINTLSDTLQETISGLTEANCLLEEDNREKTAQDAARKAFIANMSHELKTPLAVIRTYAEGLVEGSAVTSEDQAYYCGVIQDEAEKMSGLIRKLTTLMQRESGAESLEIEPFDVAAMLHAMFRRYKGRVENRNIQIVLPPDTPVWVEADSLLIEDVLVNILGNALHYVTDGGSIRVTLTPSADGTVQIAVFNTGKQIPKADLPHIFESFYKADKAHTRSHGGSGIGLAVVAAILRAHEAPFGVENRPDGVKFWFRLKSGKAEA